MNYVILIERIKSYFIILLILKNENDNNLTNRVSKYKRISVYFFKLEGYLSILKLCEVFVVLSNSRGYLSIFFQLIINKQTIKESDTNPLKFGKKH